MIKFITKRMWQLLLQLSGQSREKTNKQESTEVSLIYAQKFISPNTLQMNLMHKD
jgi:hypothetical protein